MLLAIREKAQGWVAWLIVGFISIPFALWGIQSYLDVGSDPVAVTVDGQDITERDVEQRVRQMRNRLRTQLGAAYRPELLDDKRLRQQVIEQIINESVLREAASDWNLRMSDDFVRQYIRSIPYFQSNGRFNVDAYNIAVRNQGMSQREFEQGVRQDLLMEQLRNGVVNSALVTDHELNETIRLRDQERELAYLVIDGEKLLADYQPSEDELSKYYNEHAAAYRVPERVRIEYLLIDPKVVGDQVEVTEEALQAYWQQHQDEFQAPEERKVRHILINVPENADEEVVNAARAKAGDILRRLANGESFTDLAKELSDDPGSKEQGGDLGWISPGLMAKAFEEAAYALEEGKVSEPVRTPFGFHLLEVMEIKSGGTGNFDTLRADIEAAYRQQEAEQLLFDRAEKLADLSYETPDTLVPAAEALGLEILKSDWFDRNGGQGLLASPKVIAAAFSEDVLQGGNNSELIDLEGDAVLVLRVLDHEVEQAQPFEQVKEEVAAAIRKEKAASLAREHGEKLLKALDEGESTLAQLAGKEGWKYVEPQFVKRRTTAVPGEIVTRAFGLPRPGEDSKLATGGTVLNSGNYALLTVSAVKDGDPATLEEAMRKPELLQLAKRIGNAQFNLTGRYLRERAEVEISATK